MQYKKLFDFLGSWAMIALGIFITVSGYGISKESGGLFYDAPGFLPILLGYALIGCSILLLVSSLKEGGFSARTGELKQWWNTRVRRKTTLTTLIGILMMGIYSFFLFRVLPFWISSVIFLVGIMAYLRAAGLIKIILISAGTVLAVVVFFQTGFRIQLP